MNRLLARLTYELGRKQPILGGTRPSTLIGVGAAGLAFFSLAACGDNQETVEQTFFVDCPEGTLPNVTIVGDGQETALSPIETRVEISCGDGESPVGIGLAEKSAPEDADWSSGIVTVSGTSTGVPGTTPYITYELVAGEPAKITVSGVPEYNTSAEVATR